ncbi:hypothetical protein K488DRAFT_72554 [Vararia minispora EC-137]|uniref:Uncharacterized protein n=1 Tax=Vararia minispora EC-137 TaxID=1314806 RepID=A0ACB8QDV8_9AGAM|nr:hypothetical protein K488DRAFT_72554 [Vararia minispora EC-137]
MPTTTANGRSKRPLPKLDDPDDPASDPSKQPLHSAFHNGTPNGRTKRKGKDRDKPPPDIALDAIVRAAADDSIAMDLDDQEAEEDQGVTRCVCGRSGENDDDAGEFMVQCETCQVWQHGPCMGFETEAELPQGDYYCEQCKPEHHLELLKSLAAPQPSRNRQRRPPGPETAAQPTSRASRSHSPSHLKPTKRRNTMNSRDAAYDESLQEIMAATALEAAALRPPTPSVSGSVNGAAEDDGPPQDATTNGRKKRKRTDDDAPPPSKRTRSASTASDRPLPVIVAAGASVPGAPREREETPVSATTAKPTTSMPAPPPPSKTPRNRRGGGRKTVAQQQQQQQDATAADGDDTMPPPPPSRRSNQNRNRSGGSKRSGGETRSRAAAAAAANGNSAPMTRREREGYESALLTSWGLPDHLAHLEPMFPTDTPQALDVPDGGAERASERGVKVKWPAKRMSVGDMNKRVRSLVEWVGREQAGFLERTRRRDALVGVLREAGPPDGSAPLPLQSSAPDGAATMRMMEELMEELIGFQEKFGPGAKSKERERRVS